MILHNNFSRQLHFHFVSHESLCFGLLVCDGETKGIRVRTKIKRKRGQIGERRDCLTDREIKEVPYSFGTLFGRYTDDVKRPLIRWAIRLALVLLAPCTVWSPVTIRVGGWKGGRVLIWVKMTMKEKQAPEKESTGGKKVLVERKPMKQSSILIKQVKKKKTPFHKTKRKHGMHKKIKNRQMRITDFGEVVRCVIWTEKQTNKTKRRWS